MLNKLRLGLLCLAVLPWLAGCIDSKITVHLNKDGSGTVHQVLYTKLPDLGPEFKTDAAQNVEQQKSDAEATAKTMGEGVTVQSVKALPDRGEWKGFDIVYAFEDINDLKVNPMPKADKAGAMGPPGAAGEEGEEEAEPAPKQDQDVKFEYADGVLTVLMPPMAPPASGDKKEAQPPVELMQGMLQEFLQGMKVQLQVQVEGTITETDATYVSPSKTKVGLMRMDMGGLVGDKAAFKAMMDLDKITDREEVAEKLKSKPLSKYVQAETKEQIEIQFE